MEQSSFVVVYFSQQKQTTRLLDRMEKMSEENKALRHKNDAFKREKDKLEEENEQLKQRNEELEDSQRVRVENFEDEMEVKSIQYRFHTVHVCTVVVTSSVNRVYVHTYAYINNNIIWCGWCM